MNLAETNSKNFWAAKKLLKKSKAKGKGTKQKLSKGLLLCRYYWFGGAIHVILVLARRYCVFQHISDNRDSG